MFRSRFGVSLQKATLFVAFGDLAIYILCFLLVLLIELWKGKNKNEDIKPAANGTDRFWMAGKDVSINIIVTCAIVVAVEFSVQIWMFFLLIRASNTWNAAACQLWIWMRVALTIQMIILKIIWIAVISYSWIDFVLILKYIVVISEVIVVNAFRKEIIITVGNTKGRSILDTCLLL
ncbi:unnamed protein product [Orchesella dallaii]|uniref:Uncharacterized protein n=1 Tax=Orchesella dallaii TaxID=48710 RepID=A0ABP1S7E8_9HEXA